LNKILLEKYARLIVKTGINLQKNQTLVISSPIECAEFTRVVSEAAYKEGARDVVIRWTDELSTKIRYLLAPEEVFDEFPDWQKEFFMFYVRQGAAFISIAAEDPELLKDVEASRVVRAQKASSMALKEYRERLMSNKNVWCVASVPTKAWAAKVFPELPVDRAGDKLW